MAVTVKKSKDSAVVKNPFGPKVETVNGKSAINFNIDNRREYLTGFRKRRNDRKEKAKREEQEELKVLKRQAIRKRNEKEEERLRSLERMTRLPEFLDSGTTDFVAGDDEAATEAKNCQYENETYRVTTSVVPLNLSGHSCSATEVLRETIEIKNQRANEVEVKPKSKVMSFLEAKKKFAKKTTYNFKKGKKGKGGREKKGKGHRK